MSFLENAILRARLVASSLRKALISDSEPKSLTAKTSRSKYNITWRRSPYLLLPFMFLLAVHCLWITSFRNGFFGQISEIAGSEKPKYPGTDEPLLQYYTGVAAVDRQLTILVTFFAAFADSESPNMRLFAVFGLGQFAAAWTLFMLESFRRGNIGRFVSYVGIYGLLVQNFALAVITPLYLLLHLLTSPIATPFPAAHASSVLMVSPYDMAILPFSVTFGYILPTILMVIPAPEIVSIATHQRLLAFWQPFPLWSVIIHYVLKKLYMLAAAPSTRQSATTVKSIQPPSTTYLTSAGRVYGFTLFVCLITHLPVLVLGLIQASWIPETYQTLQDFATPSLIEIFVPGLPYLPPSFRSIQEQITLHAGGLQFLQYDLHLAAIATLIWATLLLKNASIEKQTRDPQSSLPVYKDLLSGETTSVHQPGGNVVLKIVVWTIMAGPFGAATMLLWDRDMIVRQKVKQGL